MSISYKLKSQSLYLRRLSSPVSFSGSHTRRRWVTGHNPYIQTRFIHSVLCWIFSSTKTGAEKWRCVFVYQNGLPLKRNTLEHPSPDKRSPLTLWHSHVFLQITCSCFDSAVLCQCSGTRERSWAFSASLPFFFFLLLCCRLECLDAGERFKDTFVFVCASTLGDLSMNSNCWWTDFLFITIYVDTEMSFKQLTSENISLGIALPPVYPPVYPHRDRWPRN